MEISKSNSEPPLGSHGVGSFFRIAIPAWNWGRGMVGLAAVPTALSRDEMQRIFSQDLALDPRRPAGIRRKKGQQS